MTPGSVKTNFFLFVDIVESVFGTIFATTTSSSTATSSNGVHDESAAATTNTDCDVCASDQVKHKPFFSE
jgi:hypothetical protein